MSSFDPEERENVFRWVRERNADGGITFALVDQHLRMHFYSPELPEWLGEGEKILLGQPIFEIFPQLIGLDDHLKNLIDHPGAVYIIPKIHAPKPDDPDRYFDLYLEGISAFGAALLILVKDVSEQTLLQQQLIQQRNELRLEIAARQRAEDALQQINEQLEQLVSERTADLQEANKRLQALSQRLVAVQEAEKREIARELHDEVGQILTALKMQLGMHARLPREQALNNMDEAQNMVSDLLNRVRELSLDLRPAMLDDLGLVPALIWYVERYAARTKIKVDLMHHHIHQRFRTEVETAAYRIVQEALTNVARYAQVREVSVKVWADALKMYIRVEDQGVGFDFETVMAGAKSSGLSGMYERARLLGGCFKVDSAVDEGASIIAELPIGGWEGSQP